MPLLFGLVCLALGVSLGAIWWSAAFAAALQVLLVVTLFFVGLILSVVGYSEIKAAREMNEARTNDATVGDGVNSTAVKSELS
ncbi:MAG TPA: hypothetical protein VF681_03830 [Abditibacteriaceae bacterium]|jgi:4-hydroxybenzoate polyprenyltransferase